MRPNEHDKVKSDLESVKKRLEETTRQFIRFAVETYVHQYRGDTDAALLHFLLDVKRNHAEPERGFNYLEGPSPNPIEREIIDTLLSLKDGTGCRE